MWPAYLLDAQLQQITKEFSQGNVSWCPSAPYLNNENDLNLVVAEMTRRARALNLHEYFMCDFDQNEFMAALPGMSSGEVMSKINEFTEKGFFNMEPLQVM